MLQAPTDMKLSVHWQDMKVNVHWQAAGLAAQPWLWSHILQLSLATKFARKCAYCVATENCQGAAMLLTSLLQSQYDRVCMLITFPVDNGPDV